MPSRILAAVLTVAAACAGPVQRPSSEVVGAPHVDRSSGDEGGSASFEASTEGEPETEATAAVLPRPSPRASAPVGHLAGADRLARLFDALSGLEEGRAHDDVRIVQYGDSHTASDLGTGVMRRLLQTRFGDGGRGFVSIGRPWKSYGQDGIRGGMTREFKTQRPSYRDGHPSDGGGYGLLGVGIGASIAGARAWTEVAARFSRVEVDYWQDPLGGSFDVFVDGAQKGRVATRASQAGPGYFTFDLADVSHQVELRTLGDGEVRVFGMALDRSEAGVVVDSLGINGAQIFTLLRNDETQFTGELRHRAPGLVVLAYGTNEALEPGLTDDEYEHRLVEVLGRVERASPAAACLLLGPPDLARHTKGRDDWRTLPRLLEIVATQRRVADAAGCAFYDQLEAMGGPGTITAWASEREPRARRDRVHLTRTGYEQLATSLATDLLRAYDEWRSDKGLAPTGAKPTWTTE